MLRGTLDHFFYFVKRLILHYWYDLLWNKGDNLYFLGDMLWNAFSLHSRFLWVASPFSFLCQEQKQGSELLPYLLCLLSH